MPERAGGRERWCDGCTRTVHDLSTYSELEARALLRGGSERLCVAYRVGARGQVMFRSTMLDRVAVALASVALLVAAGCVGFDELEVEVPDPELELDADTWVTVPSCDPEPQPPTSTPVQTDLQRERLMQLEREWLDSIPDDDESLAFESLDGSVRLGRVAPQNRFVRMRAVERMMEHAERESPK